MVWEQGGGKDSKSLADNPVTVTERSELEFDSQEYYYHTLYHELIHAAGHSSRRTARAECVLLPMGRVLWEFDWHKELNRELAK